MNLDAVKQRAASNHGKYRTLKISLMVITMNCVVPALARAAAVIVKPDFPALLTSIMDEPDRSPFPLRLLIACIHLQMNLFHYLTFAFNMVAILSYNVGLVIMVEDLRFASTKALKINKYAQMITICPPQAERTPKVEPPT